MRKLALLIFFAGIALSYGQIGLRLNASGDGTYMRYEPIILSLLVRNETVNTFVFNSKDDTTGGRIYLKVRHQSKWSKDSARSNINLAENLILGGGQQKELTGIRLNSLCNDNLSKEGTYTITAVVTHGRLGHNIESQPIQITVKDGLAKKSIKMGLPAADPTAPIKSLDATLLLTDGDSERLWVLRVEDDKNVYTVKRLGPYLQADQPQMEFDGYTLHILLQVRAKLYSYITFAMQGTNLTHPTQKYYVSSNGLPPALERVNGIIKLKNALPAAEGIDYINSDK